MKKTVLLLLLLHIGMGLVMAQTTMVKGIVTGEEDGLPIVGASVFVKGAVVGTITNIDGEFVLNDLPEDAKTLVVTYIGMQTLELSIKPIMNIVLKNNVESLDEVVVVAYGAQRRKTLTSSIGSVKSDDLMRTPVTSLEQAMQGKLSGVQITSATGAPGGAVIVNVRGTSSISAGNEPLYVVDGLPVISTDISQKGGYQGNALSGVADINPSDIETIEVLKDASASALYGSRASNGVILITTKKGRVEKTKVTLSSYVGVQDLWKKLDFLNAADYVNARNEAIDNYNTSLGLASNDATYKSYVTAANENVDTNWLDEISRQALQTSHQLSISGGSESTQFYISGGYYYQEGVLKKTDYSRYNLRMNLAHNMFKRLRIESNIALSSSSNSRSTGDNNIYSPWVNALSISPDYAVYNEDGSYSTVNASKYNPVNLLNEQKQVTDKYRVIFNVKGIWEIVPGLKYSLNLGGDYNVMHETGYFPSTSIQGATSKGESSDYRGFSFTNLVENTLSYGHAWKGFSLNALIGYSYQRTKIDNANVVGINFLSTALRYINSAGAISSGSSSFQECALQSYFGRVNMAILDRYLAEFSIRSDASSKFAPDYRVGYFPAGSLGWRISEESFFNKSKVLSDLKVRASMGYTGNQEGIGYYEYHNIYRASSVKYNGNPGLAFPYTKPNPELTWEKTLQYGVGVDLALFNNRLGFTFDWYKKDTKDLLLEHSINALSGYDSMVSNVGNITNTGVELSINSQNFIGEFEWNTHFNISYGKNKVTALAKDTAGEDVSMTVGNCNILQVGQPMAAFYLIRAEGIYQSQEEILAQPGGQALWDSGIRPGDVKYYDKDQNGIINDEDRVICGTPFPKVYGSLLNNFRYKGFDLSIDLQYSLGNKIYAGWKQGVNGAGHLGGNANGYSILASEWEKRWTESSPSSSTPRAVAEGTAFSNNTLQYTTRYLEKADFLRIRNITIGYTIPTSCTNRIGISHCRFYVTAANLYTFTKYDGFDPEVALFPNNSTYRGYDAGSVPQLRSFVFGVNLSF